MQSDNPIAQQPDSMVHDRSIGNIIAETRNLSADQVERVLAYQREHKVRFGEAAVSLGFASVDDVMFALAQQFHYPTVVGRSDHLPELIALNEPYSPTAEFFRGIRSQLVMRVFAEASKARHAVAVVSANAGDGKSFVAANLAVAMAQLGGRTLLIDGDMRNPRQHNIFGVSNEVGLSSVLAGRPGASPIKAIESVANLYLLPVGSTPPNPLELVERPAFSLLIDDLCSKFDYIVVDTPASELGADALVTAHRCGAALPVVRKNASRLDGARGLVKSLKEASVNVIGTVFNDHA